MEQLSFIVRGYWESRRSDRRWIDNTEYLDEYLSDGWEIVSVTPMGAYGYSAQHGDDLNNGFASLVIIQKNNQSMDTLLKSNS